MLLDRREAIIGATAGLGAAVVPVAVKAAPQQAEIKAGRIYHLEYNMYHLIVCADWFLMTLKEERSFVDTSEIGTKAKFSNTARLPLHKLAAATKLAVVGSHDDLVYVRVVKV